MSPVLLAFKVQGKWQLMLRMRAGLYCLCSWSSRKKGKLQLVLAFFTRFSLIPPGTVAAAACVACALGLQSTRDIEAGAHDSHGLLCTSWTGQLMDG